MPKTNILLIVAETANPPINTSSLRNLSEASKTSITTVNPKKLQKQLEKAIQTHETSKDAYICVFDLDGTITPTNTTLLLIEQILAQRPLRQLLYKKIIKKIMYVAYLVQRKLKTRKDLQKPLLILALKGLTKEEVNRAAKVAALQAIKQAKQTDTKYIYALMKALQNKYTVLILSKTLDPLAPHIRSLFNAPTITSKLKYRDGKIAGLKRELDKARYIQALAGLGYKPLVTATDTPQELYSQFPVKIYIVAEEKRQRTGSQTLST